MEPVVPFRHEVKPMLPAKSQDFFLGGVSLHPGRQLGHAGQGAGTGAFRSCIEVLGGLDLRV